MSRFQFEGRQVSVDRFGLITSPKEVLYEFDGSRIFTFEDTDGDLLLAYQCWTDGHQEWILVVPSSNDAVAGLKSGRMTVRKALTQDWAWIVENDDGVLVSAHAVDIDLLPSNSLPQADAYISADLEPLIRVKYTGRQLHHENVPASVVKYGIDRAYSGLKSLVDGVFDERYQQGRPEERFRRFYDLPIQTLGFGSLEIAFSAPQPFTRENDFLDEEDENSSDEYVVAELARLFAAGLEWVKSPRDDLPDNPTVSWQATLGGLVCLSPPHRGLVENVELSGTLMPPHMPFATLSRAETKKIRLALERLPIAEQVVQALGFVREIDMDKKTFVLRNSAESGQDLLLGWASDELLDEAFAAMSGGYQVTIFATKKTSDRLVEVFKITKRVDPLLE
jgi:hypothetical protein